MNKAILTEEVQNYINANLNADVGKIALGKSPFKTVSSAELVNQIMAKKKSKTKLPTWFNTSNIYYPPVLSVEQTSSEQAAKYKATLISGHTVADLTAGLGIDSFYFSKKAGEVFSCEINPDLCEISAYNANLLGATNIKCLPLNGLEWLKMQKKPFDTIYIDPARRNTNGKVFKLIDCTPNVLEYLDLILEKTNRLIIKTAPLLDIAAGLSELHNVKEIHIVSIKNECKEVLWILEKGIHAPPTIICTTLNKTQKQFTVANRENESKTYTQQLEHFIYEPDVALLKSGAFEAIGKTYQLKKLAKHSHLYTADVINQAFPGRIFKVADVLMPNSLKNIKNLNANVLVRNYPEKAENLAKKYKIKPSDKDFLIFTQNSAGHCVIKAEIIQYY